MNISKKLPTTKLEFLENSVHVYGEYVLNGCTYVRTYVHVRTYVFLSRSILYTMSAKQSTATAPFILQHEPVLAAEPGDGE